MGKLMYKGVPYSATGEVEANPQGTPSDVLDSIKINGTVYGIEGGAGVFIGNVPTNYSTEEKVIGTWIDGKPLYQKTYHVNVTNTSSSLDIDSNIDLLINVDGFVVQPTSNEVTLNFINAGNSQADHAYFYYLKRNNTLQLRAGDTYGIGEWYLTIQYTKTTDTAGSGGYQAYGFSPIIYSEEEREVGVWTDGKPLYQKTINCGGLANTGTIVTPHNISNVDRIIKMTGTAYSTSNNYTLPLEDIDAQAGINGTIRLYANNVNVYITTYKNQTEYDESKVTLQYTKTTDTAGSGSYTTLGVPTVHYSTDEQVIGTWIDGKPLYQKTIYGIPFTSNEQVAYPLNIDTENCWFDFTMSYIYGSWGHRQPWYSFDVFEANGILYFQTSHSSGSLCAVIKYTKSAD